MLFVKKLDADELSMQIAKSTAFQVTLIFLLIHKVDVELVDFFPSHLIAEPNRVAYHYFPLPVLLNFPPVLLI